VFRSLCCEALNVWRDGTACDAGCWDGFPFVRRLQPRIHGLVLEREDRKCELVDATERLGTDEALEALDADAELAVSEASLAREPALAQALEVLGGVYSAPWMTRSYSRPRHMTAGWTGREPLEARAGTKSGGFTTMPSPPRPVRSSHQETGACRGPGQAKRVQNVNPPPGDRCAPR